MPLSLFALVSAALANLYVTQPVLPILQTQFATDMVTVSFTVSAVILGLAVSIVPFGILADRWPIRPLVLTGGIMVSLGGAVCAGAHDIYVLIGFRFAQGLFIPALTSCLAAYLAKTLTGERLNVAMGFYVAATVAGGLGGRLIGGIGNAPGHWRYAMIIVAALTLTATVIALRHMAKPVGQGMDPQQERFLDFIRHWHLWRYYLCAAGSFALFSSIFNYLPFRLAHPPFAFSTQQVTVVYLAYIMGGIMAPLSGRLSNRFGNGYMLISGAAVAGVSMICLLLPSVIAVIAGLLALCAGFFAIHAAAVGALNKRLSSGQGYGNALYVLFYYSGGWTGITLGGLVYQRWGWLPFVLMNILLLLVPFAIGMMEQRDYHDRKPDWGKPPTGPRRTDGAFKKR